MGNCTCNISEMLGISNKDARNSHLHLKNYDKQESVSHNAKTESSQPKKIIPPKSGPVLVQDNGRVPRSKIAEYEDIDNNIFRGTEKAKIMHRKTSLKSKAPTLNDFNIEKCLGRGAFGKVLLVTHTKKGKTYAMKILKKSDIYQNNLVENVVLEKTILEKSKHPFLVKLKYAFQTELKIYLVMEYIDGGELFTLLRRHHMFHEDAAVFYAAEVICGLEYLHKEMNVIYRDIKPENILLTKDGHIKLTDFGLAKRIDVKANTFAGTPEYLAPEILIGKGHNKNVDWWSLGILVYEMLNGKPPFMYEDKNHGYAKLEKLILENNPKYPAHFSPEAKNLIQSLLVNDPNKRLGSRNIADLKKHPFFRKISWEEVENKKLKPPYANTTAQNVRQNVRPGMIKETFEDEKFAHLAGITYMNDEFQNSTMKSHKFQQFK